MPFYGHGHGLGLALHYTALHAWLCLFEFWQFFANSISFQITWYLHIKGRKRKEINDRHKPEKQILGEWVGTHFAM
jgi:hypothetical protein